MLQNFVVSGLQMNCDDSCSSYFLQDEALLHYALAFRNYANKVCAGRAVWRRGLVD
jgi:hypothetical protein